VVRQLKSRVLVCPASSSNRPDQRSLAVFHLLPLSRESIPLDPGSPLFGFFVSPGTIRGDGQMLVSLNVADSWFNPLAQFDLKTGRITRLAGDGVSDLRSGAWTRDGGVVASRTGLVSAIWKFTPDDK